MMKKLAPYIVVVVVVAAACYKWLDYLDMQVENATMRAELSDDAHRDLHQQKMARMLLDHDVQLVKALGRFATEIKKERVGHAWRKCPMQCPDSSKSPAAENPNSQLEIRGPNPNFQPETEKPDAEILP
jgi:hypothetical protein